jgi:hypothetical protein
MGRFISPDFNEDDDDDPDPVPYADLENPQSLNLYGYGANNPLTHKDEDGHFYNGVLDPDCGCGDPNQVLEKWTMEQWANLQRGLQFYWQQFFGNKAPVVPATTNAPSQSTPADPNQKKPRYEKSDKHGKVKRGRSSAAPTDGQTALDNSTQVKDTSPRRVGVDKANGEIVVLDQTSEGVFHGHVREWGELTSEMQNALKEAGLTDARGNILK